MKKALIVLPTYNERENVKKLIPRIIDVTEKIVNWKIHILVVDDNSPDGTYDEILLLQKKYKDLHVIQGKKQGLGRAYIRGFLYALENMKPDVILEMDSDGQHPPKLLPQFLNEIDKGADFVIGSRYIKGGSIPKNWALYRKFFSYFGNNLVLRLGFMEFRVNDWTSGYRAMKSDFIKKTLHHYKNLDGYTFQIGMVDKALKDHVNIKEIPLVFGERKEGESKIQTFKFVVDNLLYILLNSSFIKFAIVGLIGFIVDFTIAALLIEKYAVYKPHANAISAEVAIVFNFIMNNYWSFKHKQISGGGASYISKFVRFNIISSGSIIIQWLGMYIALTIFGDIDLFILSLNIPAWILYKMLIIACIIIPYSYFMYNNYIWKKPSNA